MKLHQFFLLFLSAVSTTTETTPIDLGDKVSGRFEDDKVVAEGLTMNIEWELSVDIKLDANGRDAYQTLFNFEQFGTGYGDYGNRIPAVYQEKWVNTIFVFNDGLYGNHDNRYKRKQWFNSQGGHQRAGVDWFNLKVLQRYAPHGRADYRFEVLIDDEVIHSVMNEGAQVNDNVTAWFSKTTDSRGVYYPAANGEYKNLTLTKGFTWNTPPSDPEPEAIVNRCNNDDGEMILDCTFRNSAGPPNAQWTQTEDGTYNRVYSADDHDVTKTFDQVDGKDVLKMSVLASEFNDNDAVCDNEVTVNGLGVCTSAVKAAYKFTCVYPLDDQVIEQDVEVQFQATFEVETEAEQSGRINYDLVVDNEVTMGNTVNFIVKPKTPGIVFATVKSCSIKMGSNQIDIFGHNGKDMCYLEELGAAWADKSSGSGDVSGHYTAFQFMNNGLNEAEDQSFSCTIGLSEEENVETVEKCLL